MAVGNVIGNSMLTFPRGIAGIQKNEPEEHANFMDILKDAMGQANSLKNESDTKTEDFLAGKTDNIHEVMIAAQKAEVALSFVIEVRNRLVEGYQEFTRMQL